MSCHYCGKERAQAEQVAAGLTQEQKSCSSFNNSQYNMKSDQCGCHSTKVPDKEERKKKKGWMMYQKSCGDKLFSCTYGNRKEGEGERGE